MREKFSKIEYQQKKQERMKKLKSSLKELDKPHKEREWEVDNQHRRTKTNPMGIQYIQFSY